MIYSQISPHRLCELFSLSLPSPLILIITQSDIPWLTKIFTETALPVIANKTHLAKPNNQPLSHWHPASAGTGDCSLLESSGFGLPKSPFLLACPSH